MAADGAGRDGEMLVRKLYVSNLKTHSGLRSSYFNRISSTIISTA